MTGDRKGAVGGLPGYVPTGEDQRIQEVYRYWVNSNDGAHISEGIQDYKEWKTRWKTLAVISMRRYDAPSGRVGRRFIHALAAELTGFWKRLWNTERSIVFQTVILQPARNVTKSCKIQRQINQWLDAWEAREHEILAED